MCHFKMTPQESQRDKVMNNLERIILYAKDVTSYLDNINDTLGEILDTIEEYEIPHDKAYTYELYSDDEEC